MAGSGDFNKREKRKPKRDKDVKQTLVYGQSAPTYIMPEIISKKKSEK